MDKLVSIIVPVYNAGKYLRKCIDSIRKQTYCNIEIILINDGSIDGSLDICRNYAASDNRVRLISQGNRGVSAARNLGIKNAQGDYICFVDADDYVSEDYVSFLYNKVVQYDADIAACAFSYEMSKGAWKKNLNKEESFFNKKEGMISFFKKSGINGSPCCKLYKTEVIKKFHIYFDESIKMAEDKLFCFEYLIHCNKIYYSSRIKYFYVLNSHSATNVKYIPKGLNDYCLGFLAMKKIEKLVIKEDRELMPYYYAFVVRAYVRWVYRWNLFSYLSDKEVSYIRRYVKHCYINGNKQELWNTKKSYFAGMILIMSKTLTIDLCFLLRKFYHRRV